MLTWAMREVFKKTNTFQVAWDTLKKHLPSIEQARNAVTSVGEGLARTSNPSPVIPQSFPVKPSNFPALAAMEVESSGSATSSPSSSCEDAGCEPPEAGQVQWMVALTKGALIHTWESLDDKWYIAACGRRLRNNAEIHKT